jgi:hypothetical protein
MAVMMAGNSAEKMELQMVALMAVLTESLMADHLAENSVDSTADCLV